MHESFAFCASLLGLRPSLRRPPLYSHTQALSYTQAPGRGLACVAVAGLSCTPTLHWLLGWWEATSDSVPRCCEQVIKREAALGVALRTLHKAGVEGVMIDVWWGIVEHAPGKYDFSAYRRLLQKIADSGLKAQVWRLVPHVSSVYGVQVTGVL